MKTNVEALKALYLKLGGSLTDTYSDIAGGIPVGEYDLISDCILACAKKGGGGSDLPTPGTAGNVLTSTGEAWESAAPSAVNNDYIVVLENNAATHDGNAVRVTEIIDEKAAGKNVILQYLGVEFSCAMYDETVIIFSGGIYNMETSLEEQYTFLGIVGVESDSWMHYKLGMPLAAESANGKILGVSNGEYALVDALPLVVHGTISGATATITDQITIADIAEQAADGRTVYFDVTSANGAIERHTLCGYVTSAMGSGVSFMALTLIDDEQQVTRLAATYIILQHSETLGDTSAVYQKIIENV